MFFSEFHDYIVGMDTLMVDSFSAAAKATKAVGDKAKGLGEAQAARVRHLEALKIRKL